ncbi:MAG: tyrosine-type recombinase/integrase [Hyphomonadaceae bacterium]
MPRGGRKLTSIGVRNAKSPGLHPDGDGLYLKVAIGKDGLPNKSWIVRVYLPGGKVRDMGLGQASHVTLAEAREAAEAARKAARAGADPVALRKEERRRLVATIENARTFKDCSERFLEMQERRWSNPKHRQQWRNTLSTYAYPMLGDLRVEAIDTNLVLRVLEPIWLEKPETASRLRARIERILYWAQTRGYRSGDNPARWRGHLDHALPVGATRATRHHPAMPYAEVPAFFEELKQRRGIAPRALEFAILTGARTGEVVGATWSEIDLEKQMWRVPWDRMKAKREHRVPLSPQAIALLQSLRLDRRASDYVFRGWKRGTALCNGALRATLKKMGRSDVTPHGFRSSFRDWVSDETDFARELAEAALAHVVGDKTEAAYRRGDAYAKRTRMMNAWSNHCYSTDAEDSAGHSANDNTLAALKSKEVH